MSQSLPIPKAVLNQHLVMLGKTGSGKSSKLRLLVEHLVGSGKRVCVVDPKGDWWGAKVAADGRSPGMPIVLFGDFKNADATDVPINDRSGKHIAELVASGNRPCVIGLRGWTQGAMTRFWIDFASTIFTHNAGELFLVVDECHNFAPKQWKQTAAADNPVGTGLHWANRLLSEGRGLGLICMMASQRPQKVHNDTLTSCESLFALRVVHPADRDAIKTWIDGNGDPEIGKEVLASLASMPREDGWVWSPEAGFGPKRVTFPMFETFDSFAPPQLQKKVHAAGWADVNLEDVKTKLASVIEEAKANDPKLLKAERDNLRREIQQLQAQKPATETKTVEKHVVTDKQVKAVESIVARLEKEGERRIDAANTLRESGEQLKATAKEFAAALRTASAPAPHSAPPANRVPVQRSSPPPRVPAPPAEIGDLKINSTQQRILDALAWYESLGNDRPRLTQIGAVAHIDPTGGYFSNLVGPLSAAGLIVRGSGTLSLTDAGRAVATVPESAGTLDEYHDVLRARVRKMKSAGGKTVEILNAIIAAGGEPLTTAQIGEAVSIDPTGGYFSNLIGPLATAGLIERRAGVVEPTEVLFPSVLK